METGRRPVALMRGLPRARARLPVQATDALLLREAHARLPELWQPPHSHQHPRQPESESPTGRCTKDHGHGRVSTFQWQRLPP